MKPNQPAPQREIKYQRLAIFMELTNGDIHQVFMTQEQMNIIANILPQISIDRKISLSEQKYPELTFQHPHLLQPEMKGGDK